MFLLRRLQDNGLRQDGVCVVALICVLWVKQTTLVLAVSVFRGALEEVKGWAPAGREVTRASTRPCFPSGNAANL